MKPESHPAIDRLQSVNEAVVNVLPSIVARYRESGVLTWMLIRKIEAEVVTALSVAGGPDPRLVAMLCAPDSFGYPADDTVVSFEGHDFVPIILSAIDRAWRRLH